MTSNFMFGKLEGNYQISAVNLSKQREAVIDCYFKPKVKFYNPVDEYDLENLYKEKLEKKKL